MYKIGLSTCGKVICEELFKNYSKSGITAMEISPAHDEYKDINYEQIKIWAEKYNIFLWSFHLPFAPFAEIEISDKNTCKNTVKYFKELIKKGSDIGIEKFIVHPSGEPIEDNERIERMKCAKESLSELAEFAKKYNAVIAVENLPRTCLGKNSVEIEELITAHNDLMICFDTNHLLGENPVDFINKVGNKIITLHVSDYDFINERHWLPGEGELNWKEIIKALEEVKYNGVWMYEIPFSCPKTIIRSRDLVCGDFAKNADELFNNKPITVFSERKPNLGMWE